MIHNQLLLCLFGISICFVADTVGRQTIRGGDEVTRANQFPYQVSLRVNDYNHTCGGGFISLKHIITAAHCVVSNSHFINSPMSILAGTNDLQRTGSPALIIQVKKIYVPIEYFYSTSEQLMGDIAVLELLDFAQMPHHGPISNWLLKLPKGELNYTGKTAVIAGWGRGHQLQYAEALVLNQRQCQRMHYPRIITEEFIICAKVKHDVHSKPRGGCYGDDGGPLVLGGSVVGILSKIAYECDEMPTSGVYTRVSHFLPSIFFALVDQPHQHISTHLLPTY